MKRVKGQIDCMSRVEEEEGRLNPQDWFYELETYQQNTLIILSILAMTLAIAFVLYYLSHTTVVTTCYQFGAEVPCP